MNSIQGRIDQFNNALQTMWANTLDSDTVKTFVDIGTWLVKFIDDLGLIKTLVTAIIGYSIVKYTNGSGLGGILFGKEGSADSTIKTLQKLEQEYNTAKDIYKESGSEKDRRKMEDAEKNYNAYKELNQPTLDKVDEQNVLKENLDSLYQKREQMQQELATAKKDLTDMASQGLQQDVADYVGIDTTHIDQQIGEVEFKLEEARKRLADAKTKTRDDYARMGSKAPSKDKKEHEDQIRAEINEYKKELHTLKSKKDFNISQGIDDYVGDLRNEFDSTNAEIDTTIDKIAQLDGELGRIGKTDKLKGKLNKDLKQIDQLVSKREKLRQELSNLSTDAGIEVDTVEIDARIAEAQAKVDELTLKLNEAKSWTEEDYKNMGSEDPKADKKNRIQQATQELEDYKKKLNELTVERDKLIAQQVPDILPDGSEHQPEAVKQKIAELNAEIDRLQRELDETSAKLEHTGDAGVKAGGKLKGAFSGAGRAIGQYAKAMLESYAITTMMDLAGKAWDGLMEWIDGMHETPEEAKEEFEELNSELSSIKSELSGLESELDRTNDRIDELLSKDSLTLVEQEELNNLQATTSELERQIELQKTLKEQQQNAVNNQALHAADMYMANTSFYSDQTMSERKKEAEENGKTIGQAAGMAIGAAIGSLFPGGTLIGAGIGSAIGGFLGGAIGGASEEQKYYSELSVGEALNQMSSIRAGLKEDINNATNSEELQKSKQALADFDANMSEAIGQINQYLNAVDYSLLTDSDQKQNYLDNLKYSLKYNIEYGLPGAKSTAVKTLFDDKYITDELDAFKDQIQLKLDLGQDVDFLDLEVTDEVKKQLSDAGLTTTDVIVTMEELKKTEDEALNVDASDMVSEIAKVSDGINELKNAFDEFNESGIVTAKTLMALSNSFGHLPSWDEYMKAMSAGVASTQEAIDATEQLAEEFVKDIISHPIQLVDDPTTEINERVEGYNALLTAISQLQAMGVENAWELVPAMNEKAVMKVVADEIKLYDELNKKKREGTITSDEQAKLDELGNKTVEERIEAAEKKYGVEIQNTELIEKQVKLIETQEDLEKYRDYRSKFDGSTTDLLTQYSSSVEKFTADSQWQQELDKLKNDQLYLRNQGYYESWVTWDELGGAFVKALDSTFAFGAIPNDTGYDKLTAIENQINDKWSEFQQASDDRQELFNEMIKIAEEEDIDLSGINIDDFDPNYFGDDSIFNQVYERVKPEIEAKAAELEATEKELNQLLNNAFDDIGLEVKLELLNKDKLVDDIQSIYDALKNAQKEYAETGYLSVDTMQSLLGLEPKYLALLYDENGQLNLNEEALLRVAQARIIDMGLAQQKAILEQGVALATNGSRDALLEYIEVTEEATVANGNFVKSQLAVIKSLLTARTLPQTKQVEKTGILGFKYTTTETVDPDLSAAEVEQIYKGIEGQVNAVQYTMDLSLKGLPRGGLSNSPSGSGQDGETAFELWQKQYEAKLDELEHKKEMLEGEIESLEAQEKGISNDYYRNLIDNEEKKMDLYEEELPYLKELLANTSTTSEEYHDIEKAIWDIEKAMQDATIAAIKFGTAMVENWTNAADKIKEAYDNFNSLADLQKESRENYAGLLEAQGHYTTKRIYDEQNAIIQGQRDAAQKQFTELYSIYEVLERGGDNPFDPTTEKDKWDAFQAAAEKGVIAVHQELAELKNQDIAWATDQKENINAWKDTLIEAFDGVREAYENQHQYFENMLSMTDSYKSRLATWDINIPDSVIEEEIRVQTLFNDSKEEDYLEARREMIALEQQGIGIDDQRYIDAYNKVVTLEQEVYEGKTEVMAKEQEMLDNQLDRFNQVIDGMNNAVDQLDEISNLMSNDDVATENGEWTGEGLARAGLAYQSMEYAKKNIEELNEEIAHYDELLAEGKISEKKHAEVTQDLTDQLWSEIDAMQSAEDSIIDLAEARIDMIEEGLNKEIDAYEELINLKKEELDAERDLFEFRRDVEDQSKNIAEIERRMASLSSSSSNEDRAEYKRLEKELYDANRGLADTYRNHAYDQTSQALDDELESYQTNTEKYLEDLRESIKNTDELIKTTYEDVVVGSQIVLETIVQQTDVYGITIDENLLTPWKNATQETINFQVAVEGHMAGINSYVNTSSGELYGFLKAPWEDMVREEDGKPLYTYSEYAKKSIELVKQKAVDEEKNLHDGLYNGFLDSDGVVGLYQTGASNAIQAVINKSIEAKNAIGEAHTALNGFLAAQSNYNPGATGGGGGGGGGGGDKTLNNPAPYVPLKQDPPKTTLRALMKTSKETILGPKSFVDSNTETINGIKYYRDSKTGYYYKINDLNSKRKYDGDRTTGWAIPKGTWFYTKYAKGTLGTTTDEWAITDEPQYGDELVLVPSASGNLSFMRKGTGVVPADLTKRIMEIAQMPANELGSNIVKAFVPNIETTNQSIQVNFEALVKADNITNDVLPEVEKLVAKQLNTFTKNLNYSLKKVGGR